MIRKSAGFSLVEIIVALAILSILTGLAVPAYTDYVRRNRRSDAINTLLRLQLAQERWRASNITYATNIASISDGASSDQKNYTIAIDGANNVSYTMTATPAAGSPQTADTKCQTFTINESGPVIRLAMAAQDKECWNIR